MASKDSTNPLKGLLNEAESELKQRLQEACEAEAKGVATGSSAEIRRLEDTLLSAALAAERTIAARRHMEAGPPTGTESEIRTESGTSKARPAAVESRMSVESTSSSSTAVREFKDETGRKWRAWPVTPNVAQSRSASRRSLGDFQEGWICFEALDNSGRRRLPKPGRRWSDLSADELPRLLAEAINVPAREKPRPDIMNEADTRKLN